MKYAKPIRRNEEDCGWREAAEEVYVSTAEGEGREKTAGKFDYLEQESGKRFYPRADAGEVELDSLNASRQMRRDR